MQNEVAVVNADHENVADLISRIVSVATYMAISVAAGLILVSCVLVAIQIHFDFNAIEVEGQVLEVRRYVAPVMHQSTGSPRHSVGGSHIHGFKAIVAYGIEGNEFKATARYGSIGAPKVGDKVTLAYLPGRMDKARRPPHGRLRYLLSSAGIPAGCLLFVCVTYLRRKFRQSWKLTQLGSAGSSEQSDQQSESSASDTP